MSRGSCTAARCAIYRAAQLRSVPSLDGIRLWLIDSGATHSSTATTDDPFWGFVWPGGWGLARYLLDNGQHCVKHRRVLDFASGSGVQGIAAVRVGASEVIANDIDPLALEAARMNAAANSVELTMSSVNVVGAAPLDCSVVLAGDVLYDQQMASTVLPWLQRLAAQGAEVLVGDPGRHVVEQLPERSEILEKLCEYELPPEVSCNSYGLTSSTVWRVKN